MRTTWEAHHDGVRHQIHIGANRVTVSEGAGFSDIGSDWTHEEFLASGTPKQAIALAHGPPVLEEVIAAVRAAKSYPPFVARLSEEEEHRARFHAIPVDDSLPVLHAGASPSVYRNGRNGETIVRSDSLTLTIDGLSGFLCPNDSEGPRHAFRLEGWGSPSVVVAWKDLFCALQGGNFVMIDGEGNIEPFPVDHQIKLGQELRLNDCFRHPDTWIFSYWWLGVPLPRGLFRFEHGKGLTGRWQEPPA